MRLAIRLPVEKLEDHYRQRNLPKAAVYASDMPEAALYFASDRGAKTTSAGRAVGRPSDPDSTRDQQP